MNAQTIVILGGGVGGLVAASVAAGRVGIDGREIAYDSLVLALGAELAPEAIPGLAETAHTFYTLDGAERLRDKLQEFEGGRVAIVVSSLPYKCPGAPPEAGTAAARHPR